MTSIAEQAAAEVKHQEKFDVVNRPQHYAEGAIECIDAIEAALGPEGFEHYLTGQVFKYMWRFQKKHPNNRAEDIHKALWYQSRLLATVQINDAQRIGPDYETPRRAKP